MIIKEMHLFAGIGGGIYGGHLLNHTCFWAVEINPYCQEVLQQRQLDGWLNEFPIYGDITTLSGKYFVDTFDILCGGFPCQAFSHAARGNNIPEKNLWPEMFRFAQESNAPMVFAENVTKKAITKAMSDLMSIGYRAQYCKLSCGDIGADHRRDRYWLLAVKDEFVFNKVITNQAENTKVHNGCWTSEFVEPKSDNIKKSKQLTSVGNAQSPLVAYLAFRVLCDRLQDYKEYSPSVTKEELNKYCTFETSWIKKAFGEDFGYVHTPTTMANYSAPSMMKHLGCRNFVKVFNKPTPANAEYLIGFPKGASSNTPQPMDNFTEWFNSIKQS